MGSSGISLPEWASNPYISTALLVLGFAVYRFLSLGSRGKSLPPGPKTIPLLGNAHLIPTVATEKHLYYDRLAKRERRPRELGAGVLMMGVDWQSMAMSFASRWVGQDRMREPAHAAGVTHNGAEHPTPIHTRRSSTRTSSYSTRQRQCTTSWIKEA